MSVPQDRRQRAFRVVEVLADGTRMILLGGLNETAANAVRDSLMNSDLYSGLTASREIVVEADEHADLR